METLRNVTQWLIAHPLIAELIVVVLVCSGLDRLLAYPRKTQCIRRLLRVLVDLLSLLPSRGHTMRSGLQVPGLSLSGVPCDDQADDPARVSKSLIVLICALLAGCEIWPAQSMRTLERLRQTADDALSVTRVQCGRGGTRYIERCRQGALRACTEFKRCHAALAAIHGLGAAVLAAQLALKASDRTTSEQAVQKAVVAAAKALRAVHSLGKAL